MNTAVNTTQAFQERMFARMRDSMGDLMTDDDLKALLERAVEEAFFKPRTVPDGHYGTKQVEPLFICMIRDEVKAQVAGVVSTWVRENPDKVNEALDKVIQAGIVGMVETWFASKTSWPLQQLANQIGQAIQTR